MLGYSSQEQERMARTIREMRIVLIFSFSSPSWSTTCIKAWQKPKQCHRDLAGACYISSYMSWYVLLLEPHVQIILQYHYVPQQCRLKWSWTCKWWRQEIRCWEKNILLCWQAWLIWYWWCGIKINERRQRSFEHWIKYNIACEKIIYTEY